ncbi:hypothetical protein DFH09DRAFT_856968, partial [Mycena vulgaris]
LPPGEEGSLHSYAGGEALFHRMFEKVTPGYVSCALSSTSPETEKVRGLENTFNVSGRQMSWDFQVQHGQICLSYVTYFSESGFRLFAHTSDIKKAKETLLRQGYIGRSPNKHAIVFELRTFEIYRQIHCVCPNYTIDSLAKTL